MSSIESLLNHEQSLQNQIFLLRGILLGVIGVM